jgi:hypothetical protein
MDFPAPEHFPQEFVYLGKLGLFQSPTAMAKPLNTCRWRIPAPNADRVGAATADYDADGRTHDATSGAGVNHGCLADHLVAGRGDDDVRDIAPDVLEAGTGGYGHAVADLVDHATNTERHEVVLDCEQQSDAVLQDGRVADRDALFENFPGAYQLALE